MSHPNIARILDAGTTPAGQPYFAMELVEGNSLISFCDKHRLNIDERLDIFCDICSGVQHAHQKGIIHRDLKPGNIVVTSIDGKPLPKIIDFGLAKATQSMQRLTDDTVQTGIGQILGTLKYMSPEQAGLGDTDIDTRTDVYALGVILYQLLVGSTPLDTESLRGEAVFHVLERIREHEPLRPSRRLKQANDADQGIITEKRNTNPIVLNRILVGDLDWIVIKALEKDRQRRYESAAGLASDVRRFLSNEPVEARPPSRSYRAQKFIGKNKIAVVAATLAAATLIVGIIGTTWGLIAANRARYASQQRLTQIENGNLVLTDIFKDLDIRKAKIDSEPIEAVLAKRLVVAGNKLDEGAIGVPLSVAAIKSQLGYSLLSLGFAKEAISLLESATDIRKTHLGPKHPDTLISQNGLAEGLHQAGRPTEALPLFQRILEVRKESLGTTSPQTMTSMNNLAECYRVTGQLDNALPLMQRTWEQRKANLGEDHQDSLTTLRRAASKKLPETDVGLFKQFAQTFIWKSVFLEQFSWMIQRRYQIRC